jgi:hypothetical protein
MDLKLIWEMPVNMNGRQRALDKHPQGTKVYDPFQ